MSDKEIEREQNGKKESFNFSIIFHKQIPFQHFSDVREKEKERQIRRKGRSARGKYISLLL